MKRLLIAFLIAVPVAMVATAVFWESVWEPMCGEEILSEQKSPNGALVVSLFRRNCGATTDYATGLSIRPVGTDFDPSARDEVLLIDGDVPLAASWTGVDKLAVVVPKDADIFRREQDWNNVTISYVAK
jgi:hypothetical protein